jgi:hypothetical protein
MEIIQNRLLGRSLLGKWPMERCGSPMDNKDNSFLNGERILIEWILRLLRSDFQWLGRILLKGLSFAWRHHPGPKESSSKEAIAFPSGPYAAKRPQQMGDLMLWVPRRLESFIIDDLTGGFGYSHVSVDTGEVDLPTGKPVMAEVTVGQTVERKFQDEYAGRPYARIPLSKTGIDAEAFVACVKSRLGEKYGDLEALTLGEIDDPAKQVCSSLASECLTETVQREIAKARLLRLLHGASVSVHSPPNAVKTKIFISPNGFAQYYGAPKGKELGGADSLVEPHPLDTSLNGVVSKHGWKAVLILVIAAALTAGTFLLIIKSRRLKKI